MTIACRQWGALTLEQWDALPRDDKEVRLALVLAERQPLTDEQLEEREQQVEA